MAFGLFFFFIIVYTVGVPVVWATFRYWWCAFKNKINLNNNQKSELKRGECKTKRLNVGDISQPGLSG